ncbi:MAG: tRNA lysidine(34) synthetase TilS [Fimbriimonadaceae bacterium]|nr:tRNA lysidine(34) synthetase TilS [Fimbriimonadaceae bacterium]QYK55755.1 MAG: tRNA lysidine(34) synthetase TilS [Fimbriimonadaceae bacterium]
MLEAFVAGLDESNLVPAGCRVLVGYSGGPDSTCLLHLLVRAGRDVVAAHLHHGQRHEADEEAERCSAFAEGLGVPFMAGRADVPLMARSLGLSLEEAGRRARYAFFDQAMASTSSQRIATAHTADDQVETILLNLTRGTGLTGLRGIPLQRGPIVRPLLRFSRAETVAYCQEYGLWTHDDPANHDLAHSRARMRHRVVPELEQINPSLRTGFARLASLVEREDEFLNAMAAAAAERCERHLNGSLRFLTLNDEVAFDLAAVAQEPPVLRARLLRLVADALGRPPEFDWVEAALGSLMAHPKGSLTLSNGGPRLTWKDGLLHFQRLDENPPFSFPFQIPGEAESLQMGWRFTASKNVRKEPPASRLEEVADAEKLVPPLSLRSVQPGDRISPLGLGGTKLVSDVYQEMGLTEFARSRLPILSDADGIVWVPGGRLSERVRITEHTTQAVRLHFGPLD